MQNLKIDGERLWGEFRAKSAVDDGPRERLILARVLNLGKAADRTPDIAMKRHRTAAGLARDAGLASARLARTKTFSSRCSTDQQSIGLSAGACSASPLRRLKQA